MQLYLNEQVFSSQTELEYTRDVYLAQECDAYIISKMLMENLEKPMQEKHDEV